jgi:hypothetical protein
MENVFEQAHEKIDRAFINSLFSGHWEGDRFRPKQNPLREDKNTASFNIFLENGRWLFKDFATGETGDIIRLVSKMSCMSELEVAKKIANVSHRPQKEIQREPQAHKAVYPIPREFYFDYKKIEKFGTFEKEYKYKDQHGNWLFSVARFSGAKAVPFYYNGTTMVAKLADDFRQLTPLFGVHKLKKGCKVLVVSGEKCASCDVAGYVLVTWLGGDGKVSSADWSPLKGYNVTIWGDADDSCKRACETIRRDFLPQARILDVSCFAEKGYDIADYIRDGFNPIDFIEPLQSIEIDPYNIYKTFIADFYHDGLIQQDGIYWLWDKQNFYWRQEVRQNIKVNLLLWMEKKGLIELMRENKINANAIRAKVDNYIDAHSCDFATINKFADSAVSPYLHVSNGAIYFSNRGAQFFPRTEYPETFFRELFPVTCLSLIYKQEALKCPAFDYYVGSIVPDGGSYKQTRDFVAQILAYCLSPYKKTPYFFGLYGNEGTGKSFFVDLIKKLIDPRFICERSTEEIKDSKYSAGDLFGSKLFVEPDMEYGALLPAGFIKKYCGNHFGVTGEQKYAIAQKGISLSVAMFFVSNFIFRVKGLEGVKRRFIMIPFKNKIAKHDPILLDKICGEAPHGQESATTEQFDERPAILRLALYGWDLLLKNDHKIVEPDWVKAAKEDWLLGASSISMFAGANKFINQTKAWVYEEYKGFCRDEEFKPYQKTAFFEQLAREPGVSIIGDVVSVE